MSKNKETLYSKYVEYIESVREELIQAEDTVDRIRKSKEWKNANSYLGSLANRGFLKEAPLRRNGYTIIETNKKKKTSGGDKISIDDLKGIVTEEQMEQIMKLINK